MEKDVESPILTDITENNGGSKLDSYDIQDFQSKQQQAVCVNQGDESNQNLVFHYKKLSEQFEEKCKVLENYNNSKNEMIKDQNIIIQEIKSKANKLEEENKKFQNDLIIMTDAHNKELESIKKVNDVDLKQIQEKYSTLEKMVRLKDGTNKNLSDQVMKYTKKDRENVQTIEKQKSMIRKLTKESESQKIELGIANISIKNLKSELKSDKDKYINLEDELKSKDVFIRELDAKIDQLYERQMLKEKEHEKHIQQIEKELEKIGDIYEKL